MTRSTRRKLFLEALEARTVPASYTVTNTTDTTAAGSLRWAITQANTTTGLDSINFAISSGAQTISLLSALPQITDPVNINGTTQPGFTSAPLVYLSGASAGLSANGIEVRGTNNCTIRGLSIGRFGGNGIVFNNNSSTCLVAGNYVGIDPTGTAQPNGDGLFVDSASNVTVGGSVAADGNVISGNTGAGVYIGRDSGSGLKVFGNKIGTAPSGSSAVANTYGVYVRSTVQIGGSSPGEGNVISGNTTNGIYAEQTSGFFDGSGYIAGTRIGGNTIGANSTGQFAVPNRIGIFFVRSGSNPFDVVVGGTGSGESNRIAFNMDAGVVVTSGVSSGASILGNSFFRNGTSNGNGLGIDLSATSNADGPGPTTTTSGGNGLQRSPTLSTANNNGSTTVITASVVGTANANYRVEYFASGQQNSLGYGEGDVYLGNAAVAISSSGIGSLTATLNTGSLPAGLYISATATNITTGSTSEFAKNVQLVSTAATLSGTVYNDVNANAVQDASEAGQAGVTVFVDNNTNGAYDPGEPTTVTDANGQYTITVPPGTFTVRETNIPAGFNQVTGGGTVTLPASGTATVNFGNRRPGGAVSGTAFFDANQNGTLDGADSPLSNVVVYLDANGNGVRDGSEASVTTAGTGIYSFSVATDGVQTVRVEVPGGYKLTTTGSATVDLSGGVTVAGVNFGVRTAVGGAVSGTLFYDANRDTLMSVGEPGQANVQVYLDGNGNGIYDAGEPITLTAADGRFSLASAANGTFTLRELTPAGVSPSGTWPTLNFVDEAVYSGVLVGNAPPVAKPLPLFATSADAGGAARVVLAYPDGSVKFNLVAYDLGFKGGSRVATADVNGDGTEDLIVAAGPGGGPHVRVFDGTNPANVLFDKLVYDPGMSAGLFVAAADFNGDGKADLVITPGAGGGPHVRVFDVNKGGGYVIGEFFAYDPGFRGGIAVAAGDVIGDTKPEIIVGAGPGGGPHVRVMTLQGGVLNEFFVYAPTFTGGVWVGTGNVDGAGKQELLTGAGVGGGPHVRAWTITGPTSQTVVSEFLAYSNGATTGVRVAAADLNFDGRDDIITAPGSNAAYSATTKVRVFSAGSTTHYLEPDYFGPFFGGAFVG